MPKLIDLLRVSVAGVSFCKRWATLTAALGFLGMPLYGQLTENLRYPEDMLPSLAALLQEVRTTSPLFEVQALRVEEAEGDLLAARSGKYPRVSVNSRLMGRYEEKVGARNNGSSTDAIANLSLYVAQPLYAFGQIEAIQNMGEIRYDLAHVNRAADEQDVVQRVRKHYLELILSNLNKQIAQDNLSLARRYVQNQENLFERGYAPKTDVVEARLFAEEAREGVLQAERSMEYNLEALRLISGREDLEIPLDGVDLPDVEGVTSGAADDIAAISAIDDTPAVERAEATLAIEEENYRMIRARTLPRLDFILGVYQDTFDEYQGPGEGYDTIPRVVTYAGLQVNWNIFDGWETKGRKLSSLARQRMAEREIQRARLQSTQEAKELLNDIGFYSQEMKTLSDRVDLLQQGVQLKQQMLESDAISLYDVLRDELALARAQREAAQAKVNYLLAVAEYKDKFGSPAGTVN